MPTPLLPILIPQFNSPLADFDNEQGRRVTTEQATRIDAQAFRVCSLVHSEKWLWDLPRHFFLNFFPSKNSMKVGRTQLCKGRSKKKLTTLFSERDEALALTDEASLVGCHPEKGKVAGLIPGQGTCLGCGFSPLLGVPTRSNRSMFLAHIDVSLPLILPPFPSL